MDKQKVMSQCGNFIYHICIIDYLQPYVLRKRLETVFKSTLLGVSKKDLSCIDPDRYSDRFVQYIKNKVFNNDALKMSNRSIIELNWYSIFIINDRYIYNNKIKIIII